MTQIAFTNCSNCHVVSLPACPVNIVLLDCAIDADYDYLVTFIDKFGNEHMTMTDHNNYPSVNEILIPVFDNEDLQVGLFTEYSGPFTMTLRKSIHDHEEGIVIEGVAKPCVTITFYKNLGYYVPAIIGFLTTP